MKEGTICRETVAFIDGDGEKYSYVVPVRYLGRRNGKLTYCEVGTPPNAEAVFFTNEPLEAWHSAPTGWDHAFEDSPTGACRRCGRNHMGLPRE